jgi:hypothetical protein
VSHDAGHDLRNDGRMGLIAVLVVIVLVLGAAALIKYLFFSGRGD